MIVMEIFGWIVLGIIALVIVGLIIWAVGIYNRFYSLKNSSEATLGQIRVAMKKRLDMIEQLLGSVKAMRSLRRKPSNVLPQCGQVLQLPPRAI